MPKYTIAIEFKTDKPVNPDILAELEEVCAVQLESLADGSLESTEVHGTVDYYDGKSSIKVEEYDNILHRWVKK